MTDIALPLPRERRKSAVPLRALTDTRLARLAADGDERAFTAIYERHQSGLYRYALTILRDPEDASDAVQGALMKALLAIPAKRPDVPLKPWLYRIAHNEAISIQRRRRLHAEVGEQTGASVRGADDHAFDRAELKQIVDDLLALPERQRAALVMRELNGLEYGEIGISLATSAAAAKQTVYEARMALFERAKGREMSCAGVRVALSAGDRRVLRGRRISAHLRACPGCREFEEVIKARGDALAVLAPPLGGLGFLKLVKALLGAGSGGGSTSGGTGGGLFAGASAGGSAFSSAAAIKSVATLAAVAVAAGVAPQEQAAPAPHPAIAAVSPTTAAREAVDVIARPLESNAKLLRDASGPSPAHAPKPAQQPPPSAPRLIPVHSGFPLASVPAPSVPVVDHPHATIVAITTQTQTVTTQTPQHAAPPSPVATTPALIGSVPSTVVADPGGGHGTVPAAPPVDPVDPVPGGGQGNQGGGQGNQGGGQGNQGGGQGNQGGGQGNQGGGPGNHGHGPGKHGGGRPFDPPGPPPHVPGPPDHPGPHGLPHGPPPGLG